THERYVGGKNVTIHPGLDELPLFVKEGTVLPLAKPLEYLKQGTQFDITCFAFGDNAAGSLFEDDGYTFDYEKGAYTKVALTWTAGKGAASHKGAEYRI